MKADTAERTRHERGRKERRRAEKEAAKLQEQCALRRPHPPGWRAGRAGGAGQSSALARIPGRMLCLIGALLCFWPTAP